MEEHIDHFIEYGRFGDEAFRQLLVEELLGRMDPATHPRPVLRTEQSIAINALLQPFFGKEGLDQYLAKAPETKSELLRQVLDWLNMAVPRAEAKSQAAVASERVLLSNARNMDPEAFMEAFPKLSQQLKPLHDSGALALDGYAHAFESIEKERAAQKKALEEAKKSTPGNLLKQGLSNLLDTLGDTPADGKKPLPKQVERGRKLLDFLKKTGVIDSESAREEAKAYLEKAGIQPEFLDRVLEMHRAQQAGKGSGLSPGDVQRKFIKDWETALQARALKAKLEAIDEARREFLKALYQQMEDYLALREVLGPVADFLGRGFDLSKGQWSASDFELLRTYAEKLAKDESLKELADLLGRMRRAETELEEEEYQEISYFNRYVPDRALKEELVGLRESNDLGNMLPSEAALLADELTEGIFMKKFAEQKLLTYDLQGKRSEQESESNTKTRQKEKESDKGPFIVCVDTSGSMHGEPEQVAKAMALAITKAALQDKRKAYLISFSTSIETLELTDLSRSLDKLLGFLRMSFHGGTDAGPALRHAVEVLQKDGYQKADVLMVSDFVMAEPSGETLKGIQKAQSDGTKFMALTVSSTGNPNALKTFNHSWIYQPGDRGALKRVLKELKAEMGI